MIHLLVFAAALAGFACLCVARQRHQFQLVGRELSPGASSALRLGGWLAPAASFALAGSGLGWGYGTVEWLGHLSVAAALIVIWLNRSTARRKRRKGERLKI